MQPCLDAGRLPDRLPFRADFTKILEKSKTARFIYLIALSCQLREVTECARSLLLSRSAAEKLARLLLKLVR